VERAAYKLIRGPEFAEAHYRIYRALERTNRLTYAEVADLAARATSTTPSVNPRSLLAPWMGGGNGRG
jgi:hypothetical protein